MKPGYRTSEFWLILLVHLIGGAMASGLFSEGGELAWVGQLLGLAIMALGAYGYSKDRTSVKVAAYGAISKRTDGPANSTVAAITSGLLLAFCLFLPGCASPAELYVQADRATFEAVVPEYRAYYAEDPELTTEQKERRDRTVQAWEDRIEEGERGYK